MLRPLAALIAALALGPGLVACGDEEKVEALTKQNESLKKENESLRSAVRSVEGSLATITQERDDLKAAAERAVADKIAADKNAEVKAKPPPPPPKKKRRR